MDDDDFDDDPYGLEEGAYRLERGEPGMLQALFDSVLRAARADYPLPTHVVRVLLERLSPPKLTARQEEHLRLLQFIDVVAIFYGVPDDCSGELGPPAKTHRAVVLKARDLLKKRAEENGGVELNGIERLFARREDDDAVEFERATRKQFPGVRAKERPTG